MQFRFENIGPVNNAQLELGDLTVIAGHNNTGKTYLVYTLYGFLKMCNNQQEIQRLARFEYERFPRRNRKLPRLAFLNFRKIATELLTEGHAQHPKDPKALGEERRVVTQNLAQVFSNRFLAGVFSSRRSDFEHASITADFNDKFPRKIPAQRFHFSAESVLSIEYDGKDIIIDRNKIEKKSPYHPGTSHYLLQLYFSLLLSGFPDPFILSAERFGISLFYKELDFTKSRLVELLQSIGDEKGEDRLASYVLIDKTASRYALPIKDNIDYTRNLSYLQKEKSEISNEKLFDDIKDMMKGYYKVSDDDIMFKSKARGERKFNIRLHLASSSVRGLSDLYFFLRHKAKKNHLLIIDEPESHLDTKNQILLARLLSRCIHAGLKVLITTHSDYLIKEINNLIMLSQPFAEKESAIKKWGYTEKDFLPVGKIRAYIAKDNGLESCQVDKFGMDMPIFDKTIDNINEVSNDLASHLGNMEE